MEKMRGAGLHECHRRSPILPFDYQSVLMTDHFVGTAELFEIPELNKGWV